MPQVNSFNIDEFSKKAEAFYHEIKLDLESKSKGKYVAIDVESRKFWIGDTASDALSQAKKEFPTRLFYLIQVGSTATFTVQSVTKYDEFFSPTYGAHWIY
jgi:hypothetical protein